MQAEIIPPGNRVVALPVPFRTEVIELAVPAGLTVAEIVARVVPHPALRACARVWLSDFAAEPMSIDPARWHRVRPKPGVTITVRVVPQGGGGGRKNPLAAILSIVVMAVAVVAAPAIMAAMPEMAAALGNVGLAMGMSSAAAMSFATSLVGFGITTIGMLAVNAIAPPKQARLSGLGEASRTSPTLSITGSANRATPYGPVPRVLGRHRIYPPHAAKPYTEVQGDDQYLVQLFDFGYGPLRLSDIRIGSTPIGEFDDVETQFRAGYQTDPDITLYPGRVSQDTLSLKITHAGGPQVIVASEAADRIDLEVSFQGLCVFNDAGTETSRTVVLRARYREVGASTWLIDRGSTTPQSGVTMIEAPAGQDYLVWRTDHPVGGAVSVGISVPQSFRGANVVGMAFRVYARSQGAAEWDLQHDTGWLGPAGHYEQSWAGEDMASIWVSTPSAVLKLTGVHGKALEIKIERKDQRVGPVYDPEFGYSGAPFVPLNDGAGGYAFQPPSSWSYPGYATPGQYTFTGAKAQLVRKVISIRPGARTRYEVELSRVTADATSNKVRDEVYLTGLQIRRSGQPVLRKGRCLLAVRIRANDQLNGAIDRLNAVAESILPTWTGSAWVDKPTRNPAWCYAEVLRGPANKRPVADSRIDLASLKAWAAACDAAPPNSRLPAGVVAEKGDPTHTFDAVVDFRATVWDLLGDIAATARAAPATLDGKWGVVRDVAQSVPVQHFTPRNSWGFRAKRLFLRPPHALRVRFVNAEQDWQEDEIVVYADGYHAGNASEFEVMELFGVTSDAQAWREGRRRLAEGRLRPETYWLHVDIENLAAARGRLVRVAHDVPRWGLMQARIKSVATNGAGRVTAITIDDAVAMVAAKSYAVRVRLADGSSLQAAVQTNVGSDIATLNLVTPVPPPAPKPGDLVMFGEADHETVDLVIKAIRRDGLNAVLEMVDAAPAIHVADQGALPQYNPQMTIERDPVPPAVVRLTAVEGSTVVGGRRIYHFDLAWQMPEGHHAAGYEIWRDGLTPRLLATVPVPSWRMADLAKGDAVAVIVVAVSAGGSKRSLRTAAAVRQTVKGERPGDVQGLTADMIGDRIRLSWTVAADTVAAEWRVRWSPETVGVAWGDTVFMDKAAYPARSIELPARTGTYLVKAFDEYGVASANAAAVVTTEPALVGLNVVRTEQEDPGFAGARDGVTAIAGKLRLAATGTVSSWPSVAAVQLVSYGTDGLRAEGSYIFSAVPDLGYAYTARVTALLKVSGLRLLDRMSSWDSIATRETISGTTSADHDVELYVSTTLDDPAAPTAVWSDWRKFHVGDYHARGLRFKVVLTSIDPAVTPQVEHLRVTVDVPDLVQSGEDVVSGAGPCPVAFPRRFVLFRAVGITAQDMQSGDSYRITAKSAAGFTVTFYDAAGTMVSRTFDWTAVGAGRI